MIPKFTVYTWPTPSADDEQCVRMLMDKGFLPLVDSLHKTDSNWFQHNYKVNYRLYWLHPEQLVEWDKDQNKEMYITPSFSISYNDDEYITKHDWRFIHRYFEHLFYPCSTKPKLMSRRVHILLNLPLTMKTTSEQEMEVEQNSAYEIFIKNIEDRNICLIQVEKPFTDRPYTVVLRDYHERGYRSFFTALFISQSWGVSPHDIVFLKQTWTQFQMDGDFDLDAMLKEDTEACYPSDTHAPRGEPEVYRKTIDETLAVLQNKEEGRLFKSTC